MTLFDEAFVRDHWLARRPCVRRGLVPAGLAAQATLARAASAPGSLRAVSVVRQTTAGRRISLLPDGAMLGVVHAQLRHARASFSIYVDGLDAVDPVFARIADLARGPWDILRSGVRVNFSPPGDSTAIGFHADFFDACILQLGGRRRWTICAPEDMPASYLGKVIHRDRSRIDSDHHRVEIPARSLDFETQAGDAIFIPALWGHCATAEKGPEEGSRSMAIGWSALTIERLLPAFLDEAAIASLVARRPPGLPPLDAMIAQADEPEALPARLASLVAANVPELAARCAGAQGASAIEAFLRARSAP